MDLERPTFSLFNETLNYLDIGVTGKVKNIVRNKNNKFVIHISLPKYEQIKYTIDFKLLNEDIPLSNVRPGSLLACIHPQTKEWMRCYIVSILYQQANVVLCDTGETTTTKVLKDIPAKYKNIPVFTFEAEVNYICPHGKLRHLMENFKDYIATFESFKSRPSIESHKKMKLSFNNVSIDFIIKKWDPQNFINTDDNNCNSCMLKNGSSVIIAKVENYDWRHIFVKNVDQFVDTCKELQIYCKKVSSIYKNPVIGDIVAVKCVDKFYRGKIFDILNEYFSLYLIDIGYVVSASIDCIVDISPELKKIPSTVCLVGLKDINLKPWTQKTLSYFNTLFENSTTMILEYTDFDPFGLDSVTLTTLSNNEDVNGRMKELLTFDKDIYDCSNSILKPNLQSNSIIPVKIENVKSDLQVMSESVGNSLLPGTIVYLTGFVSLDEIYIRKLEDHNDEFDNFLDMVNKYCSLATPINRPLVINEIIGAQSTLDGNFYRGKVLKKINDSTYLIQFIDFGDTDNVPLSNIFDIPNDFMVPTTVMKITLDGVKSSKPLSTDTLNYIQNLLSNYEPLIIDFLSVQPPKNVTLTTVNHNENVNEQLNKLLNEGFTSPTKVVDHLISKNVDVHIKVQTDNILPKLNSGDSVYIITFVDVHNIYVRKIEDENGEFFNFIENVNLYCSAEKPIGKLPKLNEIIGAKSMADGVFYRAKIIKKINDISYNVQFIDYGIEENVNLSDIVSLSPKIKQFVPTTILIKLKDVALSELNDAAREYIISISENEILIVDSIDNNTNEVVLNTNKNENINNHLNTLLFESKKEIHTSDPQEIKKNELDSQPQFVSECNDTSLIPGDVVYITSFVNLNEIYIRKLKDYNDEYHSFLDEVNKFCASAVPITRPLVIDEIIGAQSTLDDNFYRGKVLKKIDDTTYLIHYIDFGDMDNVPVSKIFKIPTTFMIPSTVMKITLKGVNLSCALNVEASNYITNLLETYEPMAIYFDPKFPLENVTLVILNNNESVTDGINKLLKDVNSIVTNNVLEEKCETEDVLSTISENIQDNQICNKANKLKNGDTVYITSYIDIYNIFIRKVEDNNDVFNKFIETVNSYCSSGNISENKPLELNEIVGAKSSVDGCFYRGKIIGNNNENYNITFIDFGCDEDVNVANIVPLPVHLQQVESCIYLVGLQGAIFEELVPDGHNYLECLMLTSVEMKIEFEDLTAVTLTVINKNENVIKHLNELYTLYVDNILIDNTMLKDSMQVISDVKCAQDISIPNIPPLTNKSIVTIHAFISLGNIYISVPYNKSEFDEFLKDLSSFCLTLQPITRNPVVGEVLAIQSVDGSFNRCIVEEKLNDNQYKVVLLDFGTKDIVSVNSFVELPEYVKQVPQSIYSVSLNDLNIQNCNDQVMSYINMLCDNVPLIIEFDENCSNKLHNVTLTTVKTQENVNVHLAKLLAEKESDSPEAVQMLSKGDIVYITSFVDLQTVYVRRINNGTDKFKSFLENFSSRCALEKPMEKEPKVGEIIAAKKKYSKFYRAEVLSRVDNEYFNVCFIDFGSRDTIHKSNIVQPSESQFLKFTPPFIVGLHGLNSDPLKPVVVQYIEKISHTETFIIDSIYEQNKVILISVNTQCNINMEIKRLMTNYVMELKIKNDIYINGDNNIDTDSGKSVITYYYPPLEIPTQVWVAEKISSSRYLVHTYNSRFEFMRLEKQIFEDSKTFECVKSIKLKMPCIVYFSPSWYRGEILEVIDDVTAKVVLIDVGNFHVVRNISEIFHMPSKYKGKSLLLNINIQPEPQDKLSITTFKIVAKKHLDNVTVVELLASTVNELYGDLENVGLPSFSSTPIQEHSGEFPFKSNNEQNVVSQTTDVYLPGKQFSNILTTKDVQFAKWKKGSSKTLTFLCFSHKYFVMRDHLTDDALTDLETKINDYCSSINETYSPVANELCLVKYCDNFWYRAICMNNFTDSEDNNGYLIYFLDWGIEYSVNVEDVRKMSKEFVYLPATAHKCNIQGVNPEEWSTDIMNKMSQYFLTHVDCQIVDKLPNDTYTINCDTMKHLVDSNLQ